MRLANWKSIVRDDNSADVRFGSFASILACPLHVRLRGNLGSADCPVLTVEGIGQNLIEATNGSLESRGMTDFEWAAIRSFLPNMPRGIPRVDDRRVLNGIFRVLPSGVPGATCRCPMVPAPLAIIALSVGGRLASGTGSWMRWPPVTMPPSR
jgi:hypothetical protein